MGSWGSSWGENFNWDGGDAPSSDPAVTPAANEAVYPWWLQPPARNMRLGNAIGREIELWTEFEPGSATGVAKTRARRLKNNTEIGGGLYRAAAVAGDASAVCIAAMADGSEIEVASAVVSGEAVAASVAGSAEIISIVALRDGLTSAASTTGSAEITCAGVFGSGNVSASASTVGAEIERDYTLAAGKSSAAALTSGTTIEPIRVTLTGVRVMASANTTGNVIDLITVQANGHAQGETGFDLLDLDNDLLMVAA